jgi:hypothetical protein
MVETVTLLNSLFSGVFIIHISNLCTLNSEFGINTQIHSLKYSLQSQEILNRPVFVLEILKSV